MFAFEGKNSEPGPAAWDQAVKQVGGYLDSHIAKIGK